ncbi:MAG TPA: di-heme oxidoredictase family protein [Thermodesulfobacteriota bacterium]
MTRRLVAALAALVAGAALAGAREDGRIGQAPGGATSRPAVGRTAFTLPAANLPADRVREFFFGNRLFNTNWTIAPASVDSFDGLGPLFNRVSCSGCHVRDGRGRPPAGPDEPMTSMLVRLGYADGRPHPVYGDQLSDRAIPGVPAEGRVAVTYREQPGRYADGEPYSLAVPSYRVVDLAYGPLGDDVRLSPRVAPAVIGLGLLEAVPDATLLALADPEDRDGDGISGRPNVVDDPVRGGRAIGRFGWKASVATLRQQNAAAALGDIGLTTTLFPQENCTAAQKACRAAPAGGRPEVSDEFLDRLTLYTQTLAVPMRRRAEAPEVLRGERLFHDSGCAACHVPTLETGVHPTVPEVSNQRIHPFTDLLLHDMGEGLADGRPDGEATGREWRTPPLWGIGLVQAVNGHTRFLHDGRARGLAEAILWHGGEAEAAREAFRRLPKADREALLRFLESL